MNSTTVQDIERAISLLTQAERQELYAWLDRNCSNPIDARIASDLSAGRLDAAIRSALSDEENHRVRSL